MFCRLFNLAPLIYDVKDWGFGYECSPSLFYYFCKIIICHLAQVKPRVVKNFLYFFTPIEPFLGIVSLTDF